MNTSAVERSRWTPKRYCLSRSLTESRAATGLARQPSFARKNAKSMTMPVLTDTFTLANGVEIPKIGFGTWQIPNGVVAYDAVSAALEAGYRHIDTARVYGNEESVGRALRDSG